MPRRTPGSILDSCSHGKNFADLARAAFALEVETVKYVDIEKGGDGNNGDSWDEPMASIDVALDKLTAGKGGYIICRGAHDTAVATAATLDTIDVDGVHVIGASGSLNAFIPGYAQRRRSTAADLATVLITADDVEYAGFEVQGQFDSGSWSNTIPKAPLQVGTSTDGNERVYIHNVSVRDPGYTSMIGGIALINCHYPVLERVSIRSAGNIDRGLMLAPGVGPCIDGILRDMIIGGNGQGNMATGIEVYDTAANIQGFTLDNIRFPRVTNCIDVNTAYNTYASMQNFVSFTAIAEVFDGGDAHATRDNMADNYYFIVDGNCEDGAYA